MCVDGGHSQRHECDCGRNKQCANAFMLQRLKTFNCEQWEMYGLFATADWLVVCMSQPADVLITCSRPHPQCSTSATSKEALLSQLSIPAMSFSKKQPTPHSSASLGRAHTDAAMVAP
ncbi:uncharacterized protein MONOS_8768 [Monocercomonoides exilis]|uniref:uncharacterized protein n=1 Tax=Monocercomonoides exilis TaxID=2049356 RepID=UPI003559A3C7|nr:hypothetical protein MONOS_8768 [Monocercomonoides exilis]|eukprot:MONOS_8768.1-p1 / transcript=MONOS_8768.1 / gene=MONOS_8768 / organism=Monocercomonoides_exilis_PA203 / gene_product=unspecified product / transcript_product=unspecified product / location=Mono_scaffold00339:59478-60070(+) / protein_length=118 / sequence_SO=supercontig / SO=protein_coding / is_pseudo=false